MTSVLHVNPKILVGEKIRGGVPLRAPVNLTNAFDRIFLAPFGRPLSEKYQIENRFKPILFFSGIHSRALTLGNGSKMMISHPQEFNQTKQTKNKAGGRIRVSGVGNRPLEQKLAPFWKIGLLQDLNYKPGEAPLKGQKHVELIF